MKMTMLRMPPFCVKRIFNKILCIVNCFEASQKFFFQKIGVLERGYFYSLSSQLRSPLCGAVVLFFKLLLYCTLDLGPAILQKGKRTLSSRHEHCTCWVRNPGWYKVEAHSLVSTAAVQKEAEHNTLLFYLSTHTHS